MTNSDLLDSLVLQRPESQDFVNVNLNVNEEPYGVLISWLSAVLSVLPYVFAVLHAMMKHG
ncbi:MAG: hypothetical protein EBZ07_07585 [Verrucomicrobia bacterium]|nr:hypothetical protein [Verrucomicrobiota bacterium]